MSLKDTTFLRVEHYSGHPEVKAAADVLVNKYAEEMDFIQGEAKVDFSSKETHSVTLD